MIQEIIKFKPSIQKNHFLEKYVKNNKTTPTTDRVGWLQFYIGLAFAIAKKSPDGQTQHGCIITDQDHRPLGFGFNGFPRKILDYDLPTLRPDKYPWMYHSEPNAIANCLHRPENGIAYVTGQCCNSCIYTLYQNGVNTVFMAKRPGFNYTSPEDKEWFNEFIFKTSMNIYYVKPDLFWLKDLGDTVTKKDFYEVGE